MLYGYTAWCSAHQSSIEPLVKIHKQAETIIGHKLGDLQQCFNSKISNLFKSATDKEHPLAIILPENRSTVRKKSLRNDNNYSLPELRTEIFRRSFLYKACLLFNNTL